MDRSLEEIISERPAKQQNRRGRGSGNNSNAPRDGVKKSYRDRVDLDRDWVHDRFDDIGDSRSSRRDNRSRRDRESPDSDQPARLRIDNLHWDLTEADLEGLFSKIGPVQRVRINFDRAGRSEGTATVTYQYVEDARQAIREFDGANARGQPIRLTLLPGGGGRGGPKTEKSKSLFDRIERPHDRTERSLSPDEEGATGGGRRRRGGRGRAAGAPGRRSDTSKPAPDHIDRYIPGRQQSPSRRNATGRRPGERRDDRRNNRRNANGGSGPRPKKTQEELDAEMDDYWGNTTAATGTTTEENTVAAPATVAATGETGGAASAGNDDDIDMIE
ncbi:RNA binding protein, putative [Talaromyces stipitatus ATCC 10500]|uniref:RNA binding protein, putative n=1 Tax=Talaromyces stipitatus (strain ATCC 10500 / CBS 375.48 / QM 6759 / NRRL 1006) TaxID=441959 RepID=B8M9U0_TALSN|nr:RNA binding protein, putative [Talaromyces stipitatus ATCC 10500]EED18092.1 RNA binding protein, putative [Talaromyces stipitatus ATCC 10500]